MDYKRNFSLYEAYDYLNSHGLGQECDDIKNSSDKYKSYTSTLRRAKIITLVRNSKILDDFCKIIWPSGLTDKGKTRIKFFENLTVRFNNDQERIEPIDEDEEGFETTRKETNLHTRMI